jgi:hypothetical protein
MVYIILDNWLIHEDEDNKTYIIARETITLIKYLFFNLVNGFDLKCVV